MSSGPLSATKRWAPVAAFVLVCVSAAAAQGTGSQRDEDTKVFERLRQPQLVPYGVPESQRDFYLATDEIRRELQGQQPLFTPLGLEILRDLKELETRPEGNVGEWAVAMRQRYTSLAGITATAVAIEGDGLQGRSPDEREVHLGGVQKRLINLAITGRSTRHDYEGFVSRLQGR
jgi:hypothetical protein